MLRVLAMLLATAAPVLAAEGPVCIENASIAELQKALAAGSVTATGLTRAYIARIEAYDRAGPNLNAVRELNPDALTIAAEASTRRSPRSIVRSKASRFSSRTTSRPATPSTPPRARSRSPTRRHSAMHSWSNACATPAR